MGLGEGSKNMENNDYNIIEKFGRKCVVRISDRRSYNFSYIDSIYIDNKWVAKLNNAGKKTRIYKFVPAPNFLGVEGQVLCGFLNENQTLDEWIEKENKKQERIEIVKN